MHRKAAPEPPGHSWWALVPARAKASAWGLSWAEPMRFLAFPATAAPHFWAPHWNMQPMQSTPQPSRRQHSPMLHQRFERRMGTTIRKRKYAVYMSSNEPTSSCLSFRNHFIEVTVDPRHSWRVVAPHKRSTEAAWVRSWSWWVAAIHTRAQVD